MKKITLSSEAVKWLALLTMTMDHIDKIFTHTTWISNTLGRMAFPLFSYLLISNFCTYHKAEKYIIRLGIFGVLTQLLLLPYQQKNVLFLFLFAIIFLSFTQKICQLTKSLFAQAYFTLLFFLSLSPLLLKTDYSLAGFFFLIALYGYLKKKTKWNYFAIVLSTIALNSHSIIGACCGLIAIILLLSFVRIKESKRRVRWWFFYAYYPLHQLFLHSLKILIS